MLVPVIMILDRALRDAGIPFVAISIGTPSDRTTWRVDYEPSATAAQIAQGAQIVATVDPLDATLITEVKTDQASATTNRDELIALTQALYAAIPNPLLTLLQVRNQFLANLKARL